MKALDRTLEVLPASFASAKEGDLIVSAEGAPIHLGFSPRTYHDLDYPWPAPTTPLAAHLEEMAKEWVLAHELVREDQLKKRFSPINVGLLTALSYPHAAQDKLVLFAQLLAWIFIQDDEVDNATGHDPVALAAFYGRHLEVLAGDDVKDDEPAVHRALADLRARFAESADADWLEWFLLSMRGFWIEGVVEETRIRALGIIPDKRAYVSVREHSIGILPFLDFIEHARGVFLPRVIAADPSLIMLRRRTARIVTYANDVFSYEKERKNDDPNNLVYLLMHHEGLSLTEAVDRVVAIHDDEVRRYQRDVANLSPALFEIPGVKEVIDGQRHWMRGALDWQKRSLRYAAGRTMLDSKHAEG